MNRRNMEFLRTASMVEVRSEEEGFQGAWYVAKILSKFSNQEDKILVEYQTDSNQQFKEHVHISCIRPLPPPPAADQSYEPLDVVDAFHCDGWWKGIVSKVEALEDKNTVVFENPPQQFDFRSRDLRFHLVWTDGKWVPSPKPYRMEGLKIGIGMDVEVNFDGRTLRDAWFPAVVVEEVGFNSFLVEYSRSRAGIEDDHMESTVDSFHIRPPPPQLEVHNFEISASVEAFHGSCWKKGTIVGALTQGRYEVLLDSENEEIQLSQTEIRPHLLWMNDQWETPNGTQFEEQSPDGDSSSTVEDHGEVNSSCKDTSSTMDQYEKNPNVKSPIGEKQNGVEVAAIEMDFEDCVKEADLSAVLNMENRGDQAGNAEHMTENIVATDSGIANKPEMPFTKSSPFWQHVDSHDIFRSLPQKPHFSPLFECNELRREGLAIGHMVSFITLAENVAKLSAKEPIQILERYLEALADLKMLGFDVKAVADRMNKLLSIKSREEKLSIQSKEIHGKIVQSDSEKAEIEEEIHGIDDIISHLKKEKAMKMSEKVMIDSERNSLQMDGARIKEEMSKLVLDFERSGNDSDDGLFKEIVDLFHVRPLPPKLDVQNLEILECVEAFHDSCWKKGTIITILAHGRYDISFPSKKEEIRFSQSEIRPHLVWKKGKWACLREFPDGTQCGEQYANVDYIAKYSEIVVPVSRSSTSEDHKEEKSSCENANNAMEYTEEMCEGEPKNVSEGSVNEVHIKDCSSKEAELSEMKNRVTGADKSLQQSENLRFSLVHRDGKWVHKQKENPDRTQREQQSADVDNIKKHSETVFPVSCSSTAQDRNEEKASRENTNDEMDYAEEKCGEQKNISECTASEMDFEQKSCSQNTSNATNYAEENKCASDREGSTETLEKESNGTGKQDTGVAEGTAIAMDLEDCSSKAAESSKMEIEGDQEGIVENVENFPVIQELPFKKGSSLWEYVNSVDVFRALSQNLHFIPLFEHDEELREGIAIGHMLTFATLVERTSKLQVDNCRKVFESYLQVLDDLEMVGFDVKAVVNRINSLLSIKTQIEQLENQCACVQSRIAECDGEKPKAEGEINAIDEMIDDVKEARAVKLSEKGMIDSESILLQKNGHRINQHLENVKLHYENQVAEPW